MGPISCPESSITNCQSTPHNIAKEQRFIFEYISNKMQRYTVYLYLETALRVLGGTSTHNQERIQEL
jgi:hypothetical protein